MIIFAIWLQALEQIHRGQVGWGNALRSDSELLLQPGSVRLHSFLVIDICSFERPRDRVLLLKLLLRELDSWNPEEGVVF